jgi:hypothetical protein
MLSKIRTWFKQFTTGATATRNVAVGKVTSVTKIELQDTELSSQQKKVAEGMGVSDEEYADLTKSDVEPTRARTKTGKFVADDPSTPDVNEAWKGGKAPKKKSKSK